MNGAVLGGSEVYHSVLSLREVDAESACVDERHVALLVALDAAEHVLLVGVSLALQLHQLRELEPLLHAPLDHAPVTRHRHQGLAL